MNQEAEESIILKYKQVCYFFFKKIDLSAFFQKLVTLMVSII